MDRLDIIGDVSASELGGLISQITDMVSSKTDGRLHLERIKRFLKDEDPNIMTKQLLKELNNPTTWERALSHFQEHGTPWYNEGHWPFQIAVVEKAKLKNDINSPHLVFREAFSTLNQQELKEEKAYLIRLSPKTIGHDPWFTNLEEICQNYPEFNLSLCDPYALTAMHNSTQKHAFGEVTIGAIDPIKIKDLNCIIMFSHYSSGSMWIDIKHFTKKESINFGKKLYLIYEYNIPK